MREKMTLAVILEETGGEVILCNCQKKESVWYFCLATICIIILKGLLFELLFGRGCLLLTAHHPWLADHFYTCRYFDIEIFS